jgi:hypothetical protein
MNQGGAACGDKMTAAGSHWNDLSHQEQQRSGGHQRHSFHPSFVGHTSEHSERGAGWASPETISKNAAAAFIPLFA